MSRRKRAAGDRGTGNRENRPAGRQTRRGDGHSGGKRPRADANPADRRGEAAPARGAAWIYGLHAVSAALGNPERRYLRLLTTAAAADHLPQPAAGTITPETVDRAVIDEILPPGAVHQGVALLAAALPEPHIEDIPARLAETPRALVVALDQVTDPQNVGAVLRSAAAFGATALLLTERHAPEATGALAKAASGGLEAVPIVRLTNLVRGLDTLKKEGFWVVGLDMDAPQTLAEADLPARCVLVLGAEGGGLRRLTRETCDMMVRIPMGGAVESLNVSASAAVALYEWARQGVTGKS